MILAILALIIGCVGLAVSLYGFALAYRDSREKVYGLDARSRR